MDAFFEPLQGFLEQGIFDEFRITGEDIVSDITSDRDEFHVGEVFHSDIGKTRLASAKEGAGATETKVGFCNSKARVFSFEDAKSFK